MDKKWYFVVLYVYFIREVFAKFTFQSKSLMIAASLTLSI